MSQGDYKLKLEVVIIGGGFAGVYCAKTLGKRLGRDYNFKIGLISDENYSVFQPMLPEVAGASLEARHVINTNRLACKNVQVYRGTVDSVDPENNRLYLNAGPYTQNVEIEYKHLVVTLGAEIDLSRVPGMSEHALLMQNVGDALKLRASLIQRFEEANLVADKEVRKRLLTFTVVGGGYSGVETAGQVLDLFGSVIKYYHNISPEDYEVVLIHSRDHLLPTLSRKLGDYAGENLKKRGLRLILNARVKAVTSNRVYLNDGQIIETNTIVSTVGNAPHRIVNDLIAKAELPSERGRIRTEPTLRVEGQKYIWSAGDCAHVPMHGKDGQCCPPTAQFAMRQGALMGNNIANFLEGNEPKPFTFTGLGELAAIGHRNAVANVMGLNFSGFFAWFMWRTIYLSKLPSLERKLRVMIEWTMDFFFPRDINLINPTYTTLISEDHLEEGNYLFHSGEPAFSLYIVKKGSIDLVDDDGKIIKTIHKGDYFGERALLEDRIWRYNARAREESTLISLDADAFVPLVEGSTSLRKLFMTSATEYLEQSEIDALKEHMSSVQEHKSVGEIMTRSLDVLRDNMSLSDALSFFKARRRSAYPVVNSNGYLKGVVLRNDLYDYVRTHGADKDAKLNVIEWETLPTIDRDESVSNSVDVLLRSGKNKLLVLDSQGKLIGIVTISDLLAR